MRIIGLAGWSGSGKTTLLRATIPLLVARDLRVSTLKHAHHGFDLDQPGKDSFLHREAGATEVMIGSANRFAIMHELRGAPEPRLHDLLKRLAPVDLVVVEGYKRENFPKLEVHRPSVGKPLLQPNDTWIVAIATDDRSLKANVPLIPIDDLGKIVDVLVAEAMPITRLAGAT